MRISYVFIATTGIKAVTIFVKLRCYIMYINELYDN